MSKKNNFLCGVEIIGLNQCVKNIGGLYV